MIAADADRREMWGAGPPSGGTHVAGSRVWNTTPAPGQPVGWVCVASGTPGTWKAFGTIEA